MKRIDERRQIEVLVALNEMLPGEMQCEDYIAGLKAKLARLQQKPNLKLVTTTSK